MGVFSKSVRLRICRIWYRLHFKKTSIETAKLASPNAYLYRGLFSRVRVVPALRAPGVSLLRGLHERETGRKGKCRLDKATRRHPAGWHRGQQAREGSGTRASESLASSSAREGSLPQGF